MLKFSCIASLVFISIFPIFSQTYQPRTNYQQKLEPVDLILHGAGQDPGQRGVAGKDAFDNYWDAMDVSEKPISYMYYEALKDIGRNWPRLLKADLLQYQDTMIVIQFGLELVGVTDDIASGALDDDIDDLLDGIETLGLPVYLRIGYEFNGLSWNGYQPASYKAAFIYLTDKIRERDHEIATVWNFVPDVTQPLNYLDYYPGDEYVDWWAINIFESYQIDHTATLQFLQSANQHQKPVLIGESTPKYVGVLNGQSSWNNWFAPFFDLIASQPGIKMTGYINWDWALYPQWSNWGDARLEANPIVRQLFDDEMNDSLYFHTSSEKAFRRTLGFEESVPPGKVGNVTYENAAYPATLNWDVTVDSSGISRYMIYNHGELLDYTSQTDYQIYNGSPFDSLNITINAVDRAGNIGEASDPLGFTLPPLPADTNDIVTNGNFDLGSEFWNLNHYVTNVSGTLEIDTTELMFGRNSAHVTISQNSGTNWHLQLQQYLEIQAGHRYAISYQARSSINTVMETWLQQTHTPYFGYASTNVNLTPQIQSFKDTTVIVDEDDTVYLTFMLGTSGLSEIWIDSVSVIDLGSTVDIVTPLPHKLPVHFELHPPYPNPFNPRTTLSYELHKAGQVNFSIYNVLGERVHQAVNEYQPAGYYRLNWDAQHFSSGLYFIHLAVDNNVKTTKALLIR